MPGLSFVADFDGTLTEQRAQVQAALESVRHTPRIECELLLAEPCSLLARTSFREYPITSLENDRFRIVLEGQLCGRRGAQVECHLLLAAELLFSSSPSAADDLARWLLDSDGEFILFVQHKPTGAVAFLNDAQGLLPLYYCHTGRRVLVSREVQFITRLLDSPRLDRQGLAQFLLLRYPLGQRTFIEGLHRLPGGTMLRIDPREQRFDVRTILPLCLEPREQARASLRENAEELARLLVEACAARAPSDGRQAALSLSGGLDSRLVAAGMEKAGIEYETQSFRTPRGTYDDDVAKARELAALFRRKWREIPLEPPLGRHGLLSLKMQGGLVSLQMGYLLRFLEALDASLSPDALLFTGATGVNLRGYSPARTPRDRHDLLEILLDSGHAQFRVEEVAAVVSLSPQDVRDELLRHLADCPEQDLRQKYVHLIVHGRGVNWHYTGMDRQRHYFWLAHPLESLRFARYALHCPDEQKARIRLGRALIQRLSPDAARIPYTPYGSPMNSAMLTAKIAALDVYSRMPTAWRRVLKSAAQLARPRKPQPPSGQRQSLMQSCLAEQLRGPAGDRLSRDAVESLLPRCTSEQLGLLFTATSSVEFVTTGGSVLEKHLAEQLEA